MKNNPGKSQNVMVPRGMTGTNVRMRKTAGKSKVRESLLDTKRREMTGTKGEPAVKCSHVRRNGIKGLGPGSTWLFVMEVFAWLEIRNAREMGGIAGLTPTPYTSSKSS